jgi:nucleotide-binding universal stress UspA family protein
VATNLKDLDRLMLFAFEQSAATGARLLLLHVVSPTISLSEEPDGVFDHDRAAVLERAAAAMEPWCALARRRGVACDALVLEGSAAAQISAAVRHYEADLLLIGAHSGNREGKPLLGSVAEVVLRTVNVPILTVGPEAHLHNANGEKEALVIHATALAPASVMSAALASQIAASNLARLLLLHVLPPTELPKSKQAADKSSFGKFDWSSLKQPPERVTAATEDEVPEALCELRMIAAQLTEDFPVAVEALVAHGNPLIEILAVAAERQASLIILDSAPRVAFDNLTRERVAAQVIAHARCPVLVLRDASVRAAEADPERLAIRR